ncbi:MAG: hypothetical protein IK028_05470 [Bacilli bacterium]|nr:hypothetical protein [Bacilli bacterium]
MKKSKAQSVFSVIEILLAIAAITFFVALLAPGFIVGLAFSYLGGTYAQTIYILEMVGIVAVVACCVLLVLCVRAGIIKSKKRKKTNNADVDQ